MSSQMLGVLITETSYIRVRELKEKGINVSFLVEEALKSYLDKFAYDEESKRILAWGLGQSRQKRGSIKKNVMKEQ